MRGMQSWAAVTGTRVGSCPRYAPNDSSASSRRRNRNRAFILLVRDADVAAVEHGTGEILAEIIIEPARGYQPKNRVGGSGFPTHLSHHRTCGPRIRRFAESFESDSMQRESG